MVKNQLLTYSRKVVPSLVFALLLLAIEEELFNGTGMYDTCHRDRFAPGYAKLTSSFMSELLLFVTRLCILLIHCVIIVGVNWKLNLYVLTLSAFSFVWFLTSFAMMWILKQFLNDTTCSTHPNSVSGHYFFHFFYIPTIFHLLWQAYKVKVKEGNERPFSYKKRELFIDVLIIVMLTLSCITLFYTWAGGYHSLRQIIYGSLFGLISHYMLTLALFNIESIRFNTAEKRFGYKLEFLVLSHEIGVLSAFMLLATIISVLYGKTMSQRSKLITHYHISDVPVSILEILLAGLSWGFLMLIWSLYYVKYANVSWLL